MKVKLTLLLVFVSGCASSSGPAREPGTLRALPPDVRLNYLREAAVWSPITTSDLNVRQGPAGGRWKAGEVVECDFVMPEEKVHGYTPKFLCRTSDGKVNKIKYGRDNLEVYGEVIGSRLLWSLGFFSDRIDPIVVDCRGCPEDPWAYMTARFPWNRGDLPPADQVQRFEPAIIESYLGTLMESEPEQGVSWGELLSEVSPDAERAREQRQHREALTLLAGFLQHADSKPSQQSLSCASGGVGTNSAGHKTCSSPEVYIGDIGAILGDGWSLRRATTSKIDFARWSETPVWSDPDKCVVAVNQRPNATLGNVAVSEPGRAFLAERLALLKPAQVQELFEVAHVELLGDEVDVASGGERTITASDWAALFLKKSRQITGHRCP